jgi:hypothetical protein
MKYWHPHLPLGQYNSVFTLVMIKNYFIYITNYKDINIKIKTKKCPILFIINNKYFHGPSLHTYFKSPNISGPSLLFSEFVMVRVDKNTLLKLPVRKSPSKLKSIPVGVSQLQLVNLHRNRRYFVIKLHTWFCLFEKTVDTHKILINAIKFYVCLQEIWWTKPCVKFYDEISPISM